MYRGFLAGTRIDFRYLNEQEMIDAGVTDVAACVDTMEETLILLADGDYRMAGQSANSHGAQINFPEKPDHDLPRSIHLFILNDAVTGAPRAVMSANLLSAYRTGSVPGVGVKHLAVQDAESVGIIGPGVMSRTIFSAAMSQRPSIRRLKIKGRSTASTERAAQWFRDHHPQLDEVRVVDSEQEAVEGSDILIAGTSTSPDGPGGFPYFATEWLKPGALLLMPAAARLDDDFIRSERANLVVDYTGLYAEWYEENGPDVTYEQLLGIPGNRWWDMYKDGTFDGDRLTNIGDIAAGRAPGRIDDEQIFCYSIGGMPVEDVAWASDVYDNAVEKDIGTTLNLWNAPELR